MPSCSASKSQRKRGKGDLKWFPSWHHQPASDSKDHDELEDAGERSIVGDINNIRGVGRGVMRHDATGEDTR